MIRKNVLHLTGLKTVTLQVNRLCQALPECDHYSLKCRGVQGHKHRLFKPISWTSVQNLHPVEPVVYGSGNAPTETTYERLYVDVDTAFDLILVYGNVKPPRKYAGVPRVFIQEELADPHLLDSGKTKLKSFAHLPLPVGGSVGSDERFDLYFIASEGDAQCLETTGVTFDKIRVSGIPGYDHIAALVSSPVRKFPYSLVCTSPIRETGRAEERMAFLRGCQSIAGDRTLIFQLHPLENHRRAVAEIEKIFGKDTEIYLHGNTGELVANCHELISHSAPSLYFALALGKKVHTAVSPGSLRRFAPVQNGGNAASLIADTLRTRFLEEELEFLPHRRYTKDVRLQNHETFVYQNAGRKWVDAWALHE
ncbi:MAG: hypothetical protein IT266_05490 [Saprospiraceae bacterium]|nr:hypothetical protein [Saprospiraceae bacterium]